MFSVCDSVTVFLTPCQDTLGRLTECEFSCECVLCMIIVCDCE